MRPCFTSLGLCLVCTAACAREPDPAQPDDAASPPPALIVEPDRAGAESPDDGEREGVGVGDDEGNEVASDPAVFERTTRGTGSCVVTLVALLEAEEYRGAGPITPMLEASMNADPEFARMWNEEGHGDHHIQCHYEVQLAAQPQQRYRWRVIYGNTLRERSPELCKRRLGAIAEDIISITKQCTQLAAGAYYGNVLEPM